MKEIVAILIGVVGFPVVGYFLFRNEMSIWAIIPIFSGVGFIASLMTIGNLNSPSGGSSNARNQSNAYMAASVLQRQQMKKELDEVNQKLDDIDDSFGG